jgi:probable F420-dependent oxidoreductase
MDAERSSMPNDAVGRLGLTIPLGRRLDPAGSLTALAEQGYTDFWTAETSQFDAFTPLAAASPAVGAARLGTAVASVYARGPALLAMSAAAVADCAPGRFLLGVGASSPVLTRDWNAMAYERPLERVRDTVRFLRAALGGSVVDEEFATFTVRRFRLEQPPETPPPLLVGALRPGMLQVAAQEADGAILNWLSASDVLKARQVTGPGVLVAARVFVCCSPDTAAVRAGARRLIAGYLTVPGYEAFQRWLGRTALLSPMWDAWRAGDRKGAAALVPDEVVDDLVVHGTPEQCAVKLRAYQAAGVDIPIVKLLSLGPRHDLAAEASALARSYAAAG